MTAAIHTVPVPRERSGLDADSLRRLLGAARIWSRSPRAVLFGILATAALLRVWSLAWGWPHALYPDEPQYMPNALRMAADRTLVPGFFQNTHLLTYFFVAEVGFVYAAGWLVGFFADADAFGAYVWANTRAFLVLGRLTVASFGVATVWLVYHLGRRTFSRNAGLLAAAVLAVAPLHVLYSKIAVNDVFMLFFLTLTAATLPRLLHEDSRRWVVIGGVLAGLAIGAKYNAGLVLFPQIAAIALGVRRRSHGLRLTPSPVMDGLTRVALLLASCAAVFVISNPSTVLAASDLWAGFSYQVQLGRSPWPTQSDDPVWWLNASSLADGLTAGGCGLALIGAASIVRRRDPDQALVALLLPVLYFLFMASQQLFAPRFLLPMYPFMALLAGHGVDSLVRALAAAPPLAGRPAWRAAASAALVGLAVLFPLAQTAELNRVLAAEDTRVRLRHWVSSRIDSGARAIGDFEATAALGGLALDVRSANRSQLVRAWDCARLEADAIDYAFISSELIYGASSDNLMRCLRERGVLVKTFTPAATDGRPVPPEADFARFDLIATLHGRATTGPVIHVFQLPHEGGNPVRWPEDRAVAP
jgi:4-amino-4-deoxy-L-arabinose transferase-like glycosyltransferase